MPSQCEQIKKEYEAIKALKTEVETGNLAEAKKLKARLEQKRDALREKLWPFENLSQKELKEQYAAYRDIFQRNSITEKLPSGELGVEGIDGVKYPMPKMKDIIQEVRRDKEKFGIKFEQGLIEMQMTPIVMSLSKHIEKYKDLLWRHYQEKKLFATMENPEDQPKFPDDLPFDKATINNIKSGAIRYEDVWQKKGDVYKGKNSALWVWDKYQDADIKGKLVYFPKEFSKTNHQGKTKQQLIEKTKNTLFPGWLVIFREKLPNIPRATNDPAEIAKRTKRGRRQLEAGQTPNQYLKTLKTDPQYQNETGMTPEEQIIYAIKHLEQTNQVIDDYFGKGSASYQLDAFFTADGYVPSAYWARGYRRAGLGRGVPEDSGSGYGVRGAVRVPLKI